MSPEATAGLYLTLAAGLLAVIGLLVLQFVVSRLRRWQKKRREMVSYLRRREGSEARGEPSMTLKQRLGCSNSRLEPTERAQFNVEAKRAHWRTKLEQKS